MKLTDWNKRVIEMPKRDGKTVITWEIVRDVFVGVSLFALHILRRITFLAALVAICIGIEWLAVGEAIHFIKFIATHWLK